MSSSVTSAINGNELRRCGEIIGNRALTMKAKKQAAEEVKREIDRLMPLFFEELVSNFSSESKSGIIQNIKNLHATEKSMDYLLGLYGQHVNADINPTTSLEQQQSESLSPRS